MNGFKKRSKIDEAMNIDYKCSLAEEQIFIDHVNLY